MWSETLNIESVDSTGWGIYDNLGLLNKVQVSLPGVYCLSVTFIEFQIDLCCMKENKKKREIISAGRGVLLHSIVGCVFRIVCVCECQY